MKNKFLIFLVFFFLNTTLHSEEVFIQSKNMSLDKKNKISIFKDEVFIKTEENNTIKSDFAEYDK